MPFYKGHVRSCPARESWATYTAAVEINIFLVRRLKLVALHFPLDAHEPIEMHGFGFEPAFESFAGIGAKFDEHFSFEHVDEDTLGASSAASLHALRESFGALAREAGERVLREIARHRGS